MDWSRQLVPSSYLGREPCSLSAATTAEPPATALARAPAAATQTRLHEVPAGYPALNGCGCVAVCP